MINRASASLWVANCWILVVLVLVALALRQGPAFDSSIFALLPESDQSPLIQQATEQMAARFSRRLILLISGPDEDKVRASVKVFGKKLAVLPDFSDVFWQLKKNQSGEQHEELFPYRFSVINTNVRQMLQVGNYNAIKDQALSDMFSLLSLGQNSIVADPFSFYFQNLSTQSSELNFHISRSLFKVTDTTRPMYLIMLTLADDPFSIKLQDKILNVIKTEREQFAASDISIEMSGMILHAAAGTQQASKEIYTIGVGSLLGIILLVLIVFRQIKPLLLMLFPIAVGCISAVAVTMLVFNSVHIITFAFGAGLVGVSIDYALHFLCERRVSEAGDILRKILPGLLLGLFSSVLAYSAQALAPFPGLRQMAVFSVVGLIAAWLTAVLWFPLLTQKQSLQPLPAASKLDSVRLGFPSLEENRILLVILLVLFLLAAKTLYESKKADDIRLLQTSPSELVAEEHKVRKALGISSSSQFLLIKGDSIEQCLQKEEQLAATLEELISSDSLANYQSLSQVLPSIRRQNENVKLVKLLYQQQLEGFYITLGLPESKITDAWMSFQQVENNRLSYEVWRQQKRSNPWQDLIMSQSPGNAATVIRLIGIQSDDVRETLLQLAANDNQVVYIDQTQNISDLMGKYRAEIINWVTMAYVLVFVILLLRYRKQVWRIMLPPVLACVFTLALLVQIEQGVNLFHFMALILILGIGLDMSIFLFETGESPHTWLAVSMSCCTSLFAFGLLTLSDTPVLHHFGLTVLLGLTLVWLIVPLTRQNSIQDRHV